jgi:hypothetical protein
MLRSRLLDHAGDCLGDRGDSQIIAELLCQLDDLGTGAGRQRALFAGTASAAAFIAALARATLSGCEQTAAVRSARHPQAVRRAARGDPPVTRSGPPGP